MHNHTKMNMRFYLINLMFKMMQELIKVYILHTNLLHTSWDIHVVFINIKNKSNKSNTSHYID